MIVSAEQPRDSVIYLLLTVKSLQSCPTLCNPIDGSLPGSSVHGMTLRDGMEREVGRGFRMGDTCTPMSDSCQCMAKTTATGTAKSLQSCPTLCDPIDGSLPGSPVPGILQARILQWAAISFSNA